MYRPYALTTSRLHNNDAMLGVKTCRAARTCCAGRAHWRSASHSVRGPGLARRYGMQGLALWLHAWRWHTWQCLVWPPTRGGALLWCHMHMVYCLQGELLMLKWLEMCVCTARQLEVKRAAIDYMTQKLPTRTVLGSQMSSQVGKQCKLCYAFEGDEHRSNTTHCVCVFVWSKQYTDCI